MGWIIFALVIIVIFYGVVGVFDEACEWHDDCKITEMRARNDKIAAERRARNDEIIENIRKEFKELEHKRMMFMERDGKDNG